MVAELVFFASGPCLQTVYLDLPPLDSKNPSVIFFCATAALWRLVAVPGPLGAGAVSRGHKTDIDDESGHCHMTTTGWEERDPALIQPTECKCCGFKSDWPGPRQSWAQQTRTFSPSGFYTQIKVTLAEKQEFYQMVAVLLLNLWYVNHS